MNTGSPLEIDLPVLIAGFAAGFVLGGGAATSPSVRRAALILGALAVSYLLVSAGGAVLEIHSLAWLAQVSTMSGPFAFGFVGGLLVGWDALRPRRNRSNANEDS